MCAALPLHILLTDEPQIDLVNQRRWLQGMVRSFILQVVACETAQFVINVGNQFIQRRSAEASTLRKRLCGLGRQGFLHNSSENVRQAARAYRSSRRQSFSKPPTSSGSLSDISISSGRR